MTRLVYIGNDKWHSCFDSLIEDEGLEIVHSFIPNDSFYLKNMCEQNNLNYTLTENVNHNFEIISTLDFDIYLVIGHPFLLHERLLNHKQGIGFHPSLLPKRRGRAPINWAIIDGLKESGVTLFYLAEGIDNGGIIFQEKFAIDDQDTAAILIRKVCAILVNNLKNILHSWPELQVIQQDEKEATYTIKRNPSDGEITRDMSAKDAERMVRALNGPYPSAYITMNNGERLYINEASINEFEE